MKSLPAPSARRPSFRFPQLGPSAGFPRQLLPLLWLTLASQLRALCGVADVQTLAILGVLLEVSGTPCGASLTAVSLTQAFWLWTDVRSSSSPLLKSACLAASLLSGVPERWPMAQAQPHFTVSAGPMGHMRPGHAQRWAELCSVIIPSTCLQVSFLLSRQTHAQLSKSVKNGGSLVGERSGPSASCGSLWLP